LYLCQKNRTLVKKSILTLILLAFLQVLFAQNLDFEILKQLNVNRDKTFDSYQILVSFTAEYLLWLIPILILIFSLIKSNAKLRIKAWFIFSAMISSSLFSLILKSLIQRPRPFEVYPIIEKISVGGSASFPSGHTTTAFALALALAIAFRNRYITAISFIWAMGVGFSRIYCGVHYPSDILAGLILGLGCSYICYRFYFQKILK